jgi:hypothetical protein
MYIKKIKSQIKYIFFLLIGVVGRGIIYAAILHLVAKQGRPQQSTTQNQHKNYHSINNKWLDCQLSSSCQSINQSNFK